MDLAAVMASGVPMAPNRLAYRYPELFFFCVYVCYSVDKISDSNSEHCHIDEK